MRFIYTTVLLILLAGVPTRHARSIDSSSLLSYLEPPEDLGLLDGSRSCGERPLDPDSGESGDNSESEDDDRQNFQLQQLLLAGFRSEKINSYNIRQPDGFTSNGGERQCIAVQYNITCGSNTDEICASMQNDSCKNADNWIFIWTVFNTRTTTGKMLLRITVYDLRVFGFELCDVYKPMIRISINLTSDEVMPGNVCYDMCKALADFTTLLPGLSNEQPNVNNSTPEAKGYGTYWYRVENIEKHGGNTVTTFLILFIVMFKLTFVLFSYELYQRLIKQKLYKKTHKRYYTYWSAQVLIFGGLIGFSIFAGKFQSNRVALDTFWGSVIIDFVVAVVILGIVTLKANPLSEWKCLRNVDENDDQVEAEDNSRFIPPPLLVCCQCQISNERGKRCMQSTKQVLVILANGVSLFLFLAIGSYVAQALPAIAMSYYVNPTSTLIRLGFFELAIFILLVEVSYLIFLCDKLLWLCYIKIKKWLPDELSNELDYISVYVNECKEEQNNNDMQPQEQNDNDVQDGGPAADHDGMNRERQQQGAIAATQPISIERRRQQDNVAKSLPEFKGPTEPTATRQRSNSDPSVPLLEPIGRCMNNNYGTTGGTGATRQPTAAQDSTATPGITAHPLSHPAPGSPGGHPGPPASGPPGGHPAPGGHPGPLAPGPPGRHPAPGPPGGPPAPGTQNATQQKKYSCRWYWLCIVFFQIFTLAFMIVVSAPALYFLMRIVIDQTSNSNNDFKDLLSILPTIALNAWLLLKHGDIIHAMKEIVKSAAKQQRISGHTATNS